MKKRKTRNKFEQKIFDTLERKQVSFKYESEKIPYVISGHYNPDFIISTKTGKVYVETKGHFRPEAKRKMVAVKKQHPELDIRIVFYSKKKTDIAWAKKHGFIYAVDTIPDEWYEGLY